jgi:hypothetical protein
MIAASCSETLASFAAALLVIKSFAVTPNSFSLKSGIDSMSVEVIDLKLENSNYSHSVLQKLCDVCLTLV